MKVQAWQNQKESNIAETLSRKDQQLFDVHWNQLRIHGKKYLNLPEAEMLLGMMGLTCHQIWISFQNRRGKHWRLYTGDGTPGSSLCTLQTQCCAHSCNDPFSLFHWPALPGSPGPDPGMQWALQGPASSALIPELTGLPSSQLPAVVPGLQHTGPRNQPRNLSPCCATSSY
ncbi:unnamed protein product [Eretmochelys imbricata]